MSKADFVFGRKLGQGSFGEVFKAKRKADGLDYVIKTMHVHGSSRKEQQDALNEVRLLAGVDHPRVVRYHDSFCEGGKLHIVMELFFWLFYCTSAARSTNNSVLFGTRSQYSMGS